MSELDGGLSDEGDELHDEVLHEAPARREPGRSPPASDALSARPEPPGLVVPLIRGETFRGPFLRTDKGGVPLLDVFVLKTGTGRDGRPCVRPVPHARVRATFDAFDLLELGGGEAFPRARYRVMLKGADGLVMGQEDVDLGGDEEEPVEADAGFTLLGRAPASAPVAPAAPKPDVEPERRDGRIAEAIERVDAQHRAHIDDLKATYEARLAGIVELHRSEAAASDERHRDQVETLREQLDDLRREHKATERELWDARTALHQAQIEAAGLKTRLEIGAAPPTQGGVDVLGVVRAFKVQQQGMRELEAMLGAPKAAEAEADEAPQPDFGKAMQLFDKIKKEVGPVSQLVGFLDDD